MQAMSKQIALVGYGYWGPNLLRNFFEIEECRVVYCCDKQIKRLKEVRKKYPTLITTTNYEELLQDPDLDAIIIATPTNLHFPLAKLALEAGKDVLIEKPMAANLKDANTLMSLAQKKKRILMVDHTFIYNEAVRKIKEIVDSGELGKILYIDSIRANLGLFQEDVNVIYDLAPHDFSIIQYILGKPPKSVSAVGKTHYNGQEDVAYISVEYLGGITAHVNVSWLSPLKVRTLTIVGTKKMIVYDDVNPAEKIKVYDKGVEVEKNTTKEFREIRISYRSGDVWSPNILFKEALSRMANEFVQSLISRKEPESGVSLGVDVVNLLEKSTKSMRTGEKVNF